MKFQVITAVPQAGDGNLAAAMEIYQVVGPRSEATGWMEDVRLVDPVGVMLTMRTPVFHVGEVVIVDEGGREIPYPQRKPSKWSVEFEEFADLELALARARSLLEGGVLS